MRVGGDSEGGVKQNLKKEGRQHRGGQGGGVFIKNGGGEGGGGLRSLPTMFGLYVPLYISREEKTT